LFGGYDDYLDPTYRARYVARRLPLLKQLGVAPSERVTAILERSVAAGSDEESLQATFEFNLAEPLQRHHLETVDKCSMATGVETRLPYLDDGVVDTLRRDLPP
jgi:asparagine synthetase B (glutamine-hydrolysing)